MFKEPLWKNHEVVICLVLIRTLLWGAGSSCQIRSCCEEPQFFNKHILFLLKLENKFVTLLLILILRRSHWRNEKEIEVLFRNCCRPFIGNPKEEPTFSKHFMWQPLQLIIPNLGIAHERQFVLALKHLLQQLIIVLIQQIIAHHLCLAINNLIKVHCLPNIDVVLAFLVAGDELAIHGLHQLFECGLNMCQQVIVEIIGTKVSDAFLK